MAKTKRNNKRVLKKTKLKRMEGKRVPRVKLRTRVRDRKIKKNPYRWKTVDTGTMFRNKKIVVFSLPGAFTPTCSSKHLPDFEKKYSELRKKGVDEVICMSVNDAFVMHNWKKKMNIKNVILVPDGNGEFTEKMGALVKKNNLGFGDRSWRYSMLVDNGKIIKIFSEPNMGDNHKTDPFSVSSVHSMLNYIDSREL
jgi:thioredoxin-dependent peroxiredoxin